MSSNTSVVLSNLDFDTYKNSLKTFLRSQESFKDYDFDGSNLSVLIDVLAYNTYQNGFYLNMLASEMFLDSAQLETSVVSHAKELNYVPKSFSSSYAEIDILVKSQDPNKTYLLIPKGTQFSAKIGTESFIFSTLENISLQGNGIFEAKNVRIYEGVYLQETFSPKQKMVLENINIDTNSLNVTVLEDNGSSITSYKPANSLFGLNAESEVFFLQAADNGKYEVTFGDGVIAKRPKDNSIIVVEYRVSNGELPNGATVFRPISPISGETDIIINTKIPAKYGSVSEKIESIKFNAPRHFTTQERAVNSSDYENLLKMNFSEINSVTAFGGEDQDPPQYGKVFISVDLKDMDILPDAKKKEFYSFIKSRSPVSIDPVFVNPDYTYIKIFSKVKYNINKTTLTSQDIQAIVIQSILDYSNVHLNNFNRTLRYSRLINAIDESDNSVISNESDILAAKPLKYTDMNSSKALMKFGFGVSNVTSETFMYKGRICTIQNNGSNLFIMSGNETVEPIGTVDLDKGILVINSFLFDSPFDSIDVMVSPLDKDIFSLRNTVLGIRATDISVQVDKIQL